MSETSSPYMIGIIGATSPPCGLNLSQDIGSIRKSAYPDLRQSNILDTSSNQQFTNNMVTPPIFAEVLGEKISNSSSRDIYTLCRMNLVAYPINIPAPQFMDLGLSNINPLDKISSLWTPATIFEGLRMSPMGAFRIIFLKMLQRLETK